MLAIVVYGFLKASPAEDAPREAFIPATAPKPPEAEHQRPALWLPLARTQLTAKADYASESEVSTVRRVDLGTMTCDCPDFARREEEYQPLDLRRLCKHLQRCVIENHRTDLPALHVALLEDVHLPRYTQIRFVHMLGHDVAFTTNDAGEWINVFARYRKKKDPPDVHTGRYIRYGYNPIEGRWAHGEALANAPVFEVALAHS